MNAISPGFGSPPTGATALTATGTTKADALLLSAAFNVFSTVASGTGAILPLVQASITVLNNGANALLLYPSSGDNFDGGTADAPLSLAVGAQWAGEYTGSIIAAPPRTWRTVANSNAIGPISLTAAQIASPTAAILADINATYQLNVAPYTRLYSNGTSLVEMVPGNVLGLFASDFGAVGDGVTDSTTAVQAMITYAATLNRSANFYFADGIYIFNGNFQAYPAGANGKSVLLIPSRDVSLGPLSFNFIGETSPSYGGYSIIGSQTVPLGGTIFQTSKGDAVNLCALLGGAANNAGYRFTNYTVGISKIIFRTYDNPTIIPIDGRYFCGLEVDNVACDTGTNPASITFPTDSNSIGIITPLNNNGAFTRVTDVDILGYYVGVQWNEHSSGDNVDVYFARSSHYFNTATHAMNFGRLGSFHAVHDFEFQNFGAVAAVNIAEADIEWIGTGSFANVANIYDPANAAYGSINWHLVQASVGITNSLIVSGGANLRLQQIEGQFTGSTVGATLTMLGTNRATAFVVTKQLNDFTTVAAGTGAVLPASSTVAQGTAVDIYNDGANVGQIYALGSDTIDGTAGGTGVALTNAKRCRYTLFGTNWKSAQLGVVSA